MTDEPGGRRPIAPTAGMAAAVLAAVALAVSLIAYIRLNNRFPTEYWALEDLDIYQLGAKSRCTTDRSTRTSSVTCHSSTRHSPRWCSPRSTALSSPP
jgi:hypothetical protein